MYSWSSRYARRRWDGFYTRVHTIRCVWVPAATSLRARCLRPRSGWCFSVVGSPRARLTGGPDLYPRSMREARWADRWPLLFSLEWWDCFLVWGVWFPSHFHWRAPIVSIILGHNRRPAVPGVYYPNSSPRDLHGVGGQSWSLDSE
jgi:hypothetical protein